MISIENVISDIRNVINKISFFKEYTFNENNYSIYEFVQSLKENDYTITFLFKNEAEEFMLQPILFQINYNLLDDLLNRVLNNNNLEPLMKKNNRWGSFFINKPKTPITPLVEFNVSDIEKFISDTVKPFFEKWNNLNVLYEFIKDKTEVEELESILGIFWQFKKAAILRLCNDKNYQEYIEALVERFELIFERRPESIDVQRYYNAAKELKEVLDKTKPVYNV